MSHVPSSSAQRKKVAFIRYFLSKGITVVIPGAITIVKADYCRVTKRHFSGLFYVLKISEAYDVYFIVHSGI